MRWIQCFTSLADPNVSLPRFGHSAVAANTLTANERESASDLVVVYGGVGLQAGETAQTALSDVVVLQVDSGTWFAPDILSGSSPGARAFHSAVAIGSKVLVFGGHILTFDQQNNRKRRSFYNDIWQLDTVDWQWAPVSVDNSTGPSPPGRDMSCLLQLTDTQLLLFGGRSESGKALQDTWLFDLSSSSWQQLKPDGPLPPPRKMHCMVKLGANQVVLFGGERDSGPLDDLWVLRGWAAGSLEPLRWTAIKMKASPAPRFGHAMVTVAPQPQSASTAAGATTDIKENSISDAAASATDAASISDVTPVVAAAAADPAAMSSTRSEGGTSEGAVSVSTSIAAAAAAAACGERVVLFGGCLDLSSFLSLARNYVQSKETWVLDLNMLTWAPVPAADDSPCERMCHSLTRLSDGRLLLLGGRHKEGICRDLWWLDPSAAIPSVSSGGPSSASGSTTTQAANAPPQSPASRLGMQQSLLQSLLGPIRGRDSNSGSSVPSTSKAPAAPPAAAPPAAAAGGAAAVGSATTVQPSSSQMQQQRQQQQQELLKLTPPPAANNPATDQSSAATAVPATPPLPPLPQQQSGGTQATLTPQIAADPSAAPPQPVTARASGPIPPVPAAAAAAASGSGPGSSSGSSGQPLAALMDAGGNELAKLMKNPAAYSADALKQFSSSARSTVSSFLAQGQQGARPHGAFTPAAVSDRLSRATFGLQDNNTSTSSGSSSTDIVRLPGSSDGGSARQQTPGLAALRAQLGLAPQTATAVGASIGSTATGSSASAFMAPGMVLQQLADLGRQLLCDNNSSSSLPADVLVSAARQHLMSGAVMQLHLPQVALLLADYQHLAADYLERQMLTRLSGGFTVAASQAGGCSFMHRQPHELLVGQVKSLQAEYRQLVETT